jgi:hydroxymethylglutaryl-CoA synthase
MVALRPNLPLSPCVGMTMIGIIAYGAYIPAGRLPLAAIDGAAARPGGPEKAVAGFDEDAVTMAVAACIDCLADLDRAQIDRLYFVSTSAPFLEKQNAATIAKALDLRTDVLSADMGGSLRAAGAALCAAIDAVRADPRKKVLVVAADCRLAEPRSAQERNMGDAAAAFLIGADAALVLEHTAAVNDDILDVWQSRSDRWLNSWEDRFNIAEGYQRCSEVAVQQLLHNTSISIAEFDTVIFYGPDARSQQSLLRSLGCSNAQIGDSLFGRVGNCGAAFAPLLLAAKLEQIRVDERILLGFYGDGAHVLALRCVATPRSPSRGVAWHLAQRRPLRSYDSYLISRQLDADGPARSAGDGVPATVQFRERDATIGFIGAQCTACGTQHFPPTRVCYRCYAKDQFRRVRLSDRGGKLLSFTLDYFFPSPELPLAAGMCEVEGGARVYLQLTNVDREQLRCDLPLEFVFRKIHGAGGRPNYFWKSVPLSARAGAVQHG